MKKKKKLTEAEEEELLFIRTKMLNRIPISVEQEDRFRELEQKQN